MKVLIWVIFAVFLIVLSGPARAANEWTKTDTILTSTFLVFEMLDCIQTIQGQHETPQYIEHNPILGKHPSNIKTVSYFVTAGAVNVGLAYVLPKRYRRVLQFGGIALEFGCVAHNYGVGLHFGF